MTTPVGHLNFFGNRSTVGFMPPGVVGVSPIMKIFEQKKRALAAAGAPARAPVAPAPVVQPAQAVAQPGVKLAQGQAPSNKALQSVIDGLGLTKPFPQPKGFTLSKDLSSNRGPAGPSVHFGPGKSPVLALPAPQIPAALRAFIKAPAGGASTVDWSYLVVEPNTFVYMWRQTNFNGDMYSPPLRPGNYNLHETPSAAYPWKDQYGPKSAIAAPAVDFMGILDAAGQELLRLASPALGCSLTVKTRRSHPVVKALVSFMSRAQKIFEGTSYAAVLDNKLQTVLQQVDSAALSNQGACAPVAPIAPPPPPTAQFFVVLGGAAKGPLALRQVGAMISARQVVRQTPAWKRGLAAWTPAVQIPELQPFFASLPPQLPVTPPVAPPVVQPQRAPCRFEGDPGRRAAFRASSSHQQTTPNCFRVTQEIWRARMR